MKHLLSEQQYNKEETIREVARILNKTQGEIAAYLDKTIYTPHIIMMAVLSDVKELDDESVRSWLLE